MLKNIIYLSFICLFAGICSYKFFDTEFISTNVLPQVEKIEKSEYNGKIIGYISGQYEHIYKKKN